ncbi:MAG: hypothetical protein FJY82_03375 [Candidatus Aminicenantes bacterium]|nr:hypothetical protein [Candidatus Aminicenantes bacterium]
MLQDRKRAWATILAVSVFFGGFALLADLPALHRGFLFADQAVYYAMAQSIVFDGDLEYTSKDLIRYREDFWAGPLGIFLKRVKTAEGEKLFYSKSLVYPLFAAPFVRAFGPNGPLVFQAVLLFLLLAMGFSYFSLANSPGLSLLHVLTFLLASVAGVYAFWIAPDFFNLFCVFTVLFLWLHKRRRRESGAEDSGPPEGRLHRFLLSDGSDYAAAFVAGIAAASKPPNVAVLGPLLLWALLRKKFLKAGGLALAFALSLGLLFGANVLLTGEWNYQGGDRKSFVPRSDQGFPLERPEWTFDSSPGKVMSTDQYGPAEAMLPAKFVPVNLFYYVFGRFTGIAWYFFPALLALILFALGRKRLEQWLLFAAVAGEILLYVILMPDNYGGGGGSLANRYFLGIYPMCLFLPGIKVRRNLLLVSWAMASLFLSPILLSPHLSSAHPATHAKRFPYTLLPVEMTNINSLPTTTTPSAYRQQWGDPGDPLYHDRFIYFLNDNYNPKHPNENGWWTLGDRRCDLILRTSFPVEEVVFKLLNNPRLQNEITVAVEGKRQKAVLGSNLWGTLRFPVGGGFRVRHSHMYRIRIRAAKGAMPHYEHDRTDEKRWLGVFFELVPVPAGTK